MTPRARDVRRGPLEEGVVLAASARHAVVLVTGAAARCAFRKELFRSDEGPRSRPVAAGDRVLIQVRQMLLEACRQSDTIIRWGGDEFLLVGRNADPQTAENLAERIRIVMEEKKFDVGLEQTVHLSCSIGFAFYPFDSARPSFFSWEQVIGVADRALYVAKESGRNTWTGILSTSRGNRPADLFKRLNEDLETLVNEGIVELRDSGHRRPRLVREPRTGASR